MGPAMTGGARRTAGGCARTGAGGTVEVRSLRRLTGGASRETWSFDAVRRRRAPLVHELILRRRCTASGPRALMGLLRGPGYSAWPGAGVPVPEVLVDTDDTRVWGAAGLVMRRVEGEALGKRILRSEDLSAAR